MEVLKNKRKSSLASIAAFASFADGAGGWIEKKSPVVGLPVVVARDPETQRPNQNQQRRRERPPAMMGVDERRVERRKVRSPFVIGSFEGAQSGINPERTKQRYGGYQLQPPRILAHRAAETALSPSG